MTLIAGGAPENPLYHLYRMDGYAHHLRAIGHLHEAEDESQEFRELHAAIRAARKAYQTDGMIPDWQAFEGLIAATRLT